MFRFFILRVLAFLLLFLFVRSLLRAIFPPQRTTFGRNPPHPVVGGELKRDPVCGTFVSPTLGFTRTVNGEVLHFCSAECRDKFKPGRAS